MRPPPASPSTSSQQSAAAFAQGRQLGSFQALMYRNRSQTQSPTYALTIFWRPHNNTANPSRWENQAFYDAVNAGIAQTDPLDAVAGHYWNQAMAIELNSAPESSSRTCSPHRPTGAPCTATRIALRTRWTSPT